MTTVARRLGSMLAFGALMGSPARADTIWVEQIGSGRPAASVAFRGSAPTTEGGHRTEPSARPLQRASTDAEVERPSARLGPSLAQTGSGNWIARSVSNSGGEATLAQTGFQNGIGLLQSGSNGAVTAIQTGSRNEMSIVQSGDKLVLSTSQTGSLNTMSLQQSGTLGTIVAVQSGTANHLEAIQTGSGNRLASSQR